VFGTATAPGTAFPSGHAADSTAVFVSVALVLAVSVLRRPAARAAVIVVGIAMAVAVGLSRLVLDVHWPTDVVAGWALGTMAALVVTTPVLLRSTPADPGPDRLLHHTP
jgi:undecaprenyl-diphosphatase